MHTLLTYIAKAPAAVRAAFAILATRKDERADALCRLYQLDPRTVTDDQLNLAYRKQILLIGQFVTKAQQKSRCLVPRKIGALEDPDFSLFELAYNLASEAQPYRQHHDTDEGTVTGELREQARAYARELEELLDAARDKATIRRLESALRATKSVVGIPTTDEGTAASWLDADEEEDELAALARARENKVSFWQAPEPTNERHENRYDHPEQGVETVHHTRENPGRPGVFRIITD